MDFRDYVKGKKITVLGLGLLGRGVGDVAFLSRCGARVTVTDLKTRETLAPSIQKLSKFKNITYHLGGHRLEDFRNADMVIKAAGVPLNSPYIAEAKKHGISIEMSTALFAKFSPATTVGITGTRGKSTVTHLIYEILKGTKKKTFLGGNVRGISTLPLLKKVKKGDYVVMELDSWQLQGFGEGKLSPHVAVFTTFMEDHLNYYKGDMETYLKDKANIFLHQNKEDILVLGESVSSTIREKYGNRIHSSIIPPARIPSDWSVCLLGNHNKNNISLALAVADTLGVSRSISRRAIEKFKGVSGRMQLVRKVRGVRFYNDTTATTPQATCVALEALARNKNVVLIMGGADKKIDMSILLKSIPHHVKNLVVLPGTGTDTISAAVGKLSVPHAFVSSMKEAVGEALACTVKGDIILLSPAFASFGLFKNEFDRGEQFDRLVKMIHA